jgi:hypothetical protein
MRPLRADGVSLPEIKNYNNSIFLENKSRDTINLYFFLGVPRSSFHRFGYFIRKGLLSEPVRLPEGLRLPAFVVPLRIG